MTRARRLAAGGRIDRSRPLRFTYEGAVLHGYAGDTLASALLANGIGIVGSGIYSGRPRGIVAAGVEDPGGLVQVELPGGSEPMVRAAAVELFDGLAARGLAGKGRLSVERETARFDKRFVHCDVQIGRAHV